MGAALAKQSCDRYQNGEHPMTRISWFDAYGFNQVAFPEITGETYRLPTEEEWSYVAGSGKDITELTIEQLIQKTAKWRGTNTLGPALRKPENSGRLERLNGVFQI